MLILQSFCDVLFPQHCVSCGSWMLSQSTRFPCCSICSMRWPDLRGSIGRILMQERLATKWGQVGFRLRGCDFLERQIRDIKYRGDRKLAWHWGRWLASGAEEVPFPRESLVLVPIPLHWRRQLNRGFNQAEWVAKGIASVWNVPIEPKLLGRAKHGASLTGMNRRERREKLDMTYFYREGVLEAPRNVLLVDDVLTTGTTFRMCASALDDSPHRVVGTLALALA